MTASSNPYPGGPDRTRDEILPKLITKPWVRPEAAALLIKNVRVVDPATASVSEPVDVTVENGRVKSIGQTDTSPLGSGRTIDLDGKFICPGPIDCHVHVTAVPGVRTMGELLDMPEELISLRTSYVLKDMLSRGFTTVRDTGGASKSIATAIEEGLIDGPRLFVCGKGISQTGGHGDFRKEPRPSATSCCGSVRSICRVADGVDAVIKATREELSLGADFIKSRPGGLSAEQVMAGGGVASPTDAIETVQFLAEEIQAITRTCKQMGNFHVTAHAYTVESINHAIDNGVRGIEHGNLIDEPTAQRMAKEGIFLTPTLSCYGIMVRPPFENFLPESGKKKNEEVMKQGLQALLLAESAGVTVCYGTDLLVSMHALQTEEFTVRASILPSANILRHATINAAKLLRRTGELGTLIPGAIADIIVLDANPLDDIHILDRPETHLFAVIKEGRVARSRIEGLPAEPLA
ncbi:hypothetical protein BKA62DRAFT_820581 [Auriculariales sp. MPI-PUGE-AT-0066]|nr:hypothetical protein BKA62DRAFT_820581 [Auriculariales sp. MPI-PUGE-AT-0066]